MEIVVVIIACVLGAILCGIRELYKVLETAQQRHCLAADQRALLTATNDPELTRLIILLREDLYDRSRAQAKLRQIAANPQQAAIAFRTALHSNDLRMQKVGIAGLAHLNRPEGVQPLLRLYTIRGRPAP